MSPRSLEDVLKTRSAVDLARNSQIGPYVYPSVPSEFTNWRDEQHAWRETCCLFDQSFHMTDLYIKGPDALKLLSDLAINSFDNFAVDKAKQFVACNYDGYVIGDAILFYLDKDLLSLVGRPSAHNWVQYHCETGGYDATTERDERAAVNPGNRKLYRYQVQGPNALEVLEKVNGGALPEIRFFNMGVITIAGHDVRALHHGMSGVPGLELFGPWEQGAAVKAAIVEAGAQFGLRQVGSRVYATNTLESGWIPCPLPAIFTGERMKAYREWLPANWYEGTGSLGGSYYSDEISDYYLTPYDLGYGGFVRFDHDFIGRDAVEKMSQDPKRQKVTLAWHGEDVAAAMETTFHKGDRAKYIDLPLSNYSTWPNDRIMKDGEMVGVSTFSGYSSNESSMLSLAIVDVEHAEPGTEVALVWGEEGGGSHKPVVERHVQTEIRATVSPVPYAEVVRASYRPK
ncbi:MAG: aminomethyl transferase family protein [Actinomycetota bacterium]|nr:aminomethyl transferase family protein [Actinomycetota bacterium]